MPSKTTIICAHCKKEHEKPTQYVKENKKLDRQNFCSRQCNTDYRTTSVETICSNCNEPVTVRQYPYNKSKTKRFFCNKSCAAQYNNRNKTYGIRRSKLEQYIEERLKEDFDELNILFNNKSAIGSELDVYCPDLKLAIEINGIVHYEPIYGQDQFERIVDRDKQKGRSCYEKGIELAVINTANHSYVTPQTCDVYY